MPLRILFLNPYHGGSHKDFAEGWCQHTKHDITLHTLAAHHWKWRMRHGAWTFAETLSSSHQPFDIVFTTDMLDVPLWKARASSALRDLPTVVYFHENQLTYPDDKRDNHYGLTNILSAASADSVWFNSAYHRDDFLAAARSLCSVLPSGHLNTLPKRIREKSLIVFPGIRPIAPSDHMCRTAAGPLQLLWIGRWETDKGNQDLMTALRELGDADYQLRVVGANPSAEDREQLERICGSRLLFIGYADTDVEYQSILSISDVVVSTAHHEFFGIAIAEAVAAGTMPALPRRLAYPEVFHDFGDGIFYGDSPQQLARHLRELIALGRSEIHDSVSSGGVRRLQNLAWPTQAKCLDQLCERLHNQSNTDYA